MTALEDHEKHLHAHGENKNASLNPETTRETPPCTWRK